MSLKLILIRHGHALHGFGIKDFNRQLSSLGSAQANEIGVYLNQNNVKPDLVLYSDAQRTTSTMDSILKHIAHENIRTISNPNLYLCNSEKIAEELASINNEEINTIILIGHNNGLSDFFNQLTNQPIYHNLSTCETATIHLDIKNWVDIYECKATLVSIKKTNNTNL